MLNIRSQQNEELMTSIGMTLDIVRKIIMDESNRRGRPRRRWIDDMEE